MATTFPLPSSPTVGQTQTLTSGATVRWDGARWVMVGSLPADAPFDSSQYTRRNGLWVPNTIASTQITDATTVGKGVLTSADDVAARGFTNAAKNLSYGGWRNKIINPQMQVVQYNNGTAHTTIMTRYVIDMWKVYSNSSNAINVTPTVNPSSGIVGIPNFIRLTANAVNTVASNTYFLFGQAFEGVSYSELGWGTATAQPAVISFYARSSVTGTYSVALRDSAQTVSFVAPFTIATANTWTKYVINVPAVTTGNFQINTLAFGGDILFNIGSGSAAQTATLNAWQAANVYGATGSANAMGTNGATWDLAGVQLEVGTVATPFEHRPYPVELAMCQRYWQSDIADGRPIIVVRSNTSGAFGGVQPFIRPYTVPMRALPTVSVYTNTSRANVGNVLVNNTTASNSFVSQIYAGAFAIHNNAALTAVGDYFYTWGDYDARI